MSSAGAALRAFPLTRLCVLPCFRVGVPLHVHVSAGQLWTTRGEWAWRVWSITRSGEIAFSEVRTFVH